jgi:DNA-binding GntR family transcriptional regulator
VIIDSVSGVERPQVPRAAPVATPGALRVRGRSRYVVELAERDRSLVTALRSGDQVLAAAAIRQHIWEVAEPVLPTIPTPEEERDTPTDG